MVLSSSLFFSLPPHPGTLLGHYGPPGTVPTLSDHHDPCARYPPYHDPEEPTETAKPKGEHSTRVKANETTEANDQILGLKTLKLQELMDRKGEENAQVARVDGSKG